MSNVNYMSKSRKMDNPYQIWRNDSGWEWRVLKSYQADTSKEYARAFCAVSSPYTFGGHDMGDVYWSDIFDNATLVYSDIP